MSALKTANIYHSLFLHFNTESYDAIKYNFKHKKKLISDSQFYTFDRIYKRYKKETFPFLLANFIENEKVWINDLLNDHCHEIYINWKNKNESLSFVFESDVKKLFEQGTLKEVLTKGNPYPIIVREQWKRKVEIETVLIFNRFCKFLDVINKRLKDDLVWHPFYLKCCNYDRFFSFDKKRCFEILKREIGD